jgi:hypothetical protein
MRSAARRLIQASLVAIVIAVFSHTRADPDLWGHVRFGGDTVAARAIQTVDPYSFTSDRPWINHEWLAESLMYLSYAAAAGAGLVLLKVVVLLGMLWAAVTSWPKTIPSRLRPLLIGLVLVGTVPQANHVRPQLFSLLLFAILLTLLVRAVPTVRDQVRRGVLIATVMAVWANLHGGWIVGLGTLAVWTAIEVLTSRAMPQRIVLVLTAVAGVLATLANPYGWHLWQFIRQTVGLGRAQITDWQPVYALGGAYLGIWIAVAIAAAFAGFRMARRRVLDPCLAVAVMLGVGSFRVNRLLAFFALAVATLLARALAAPAGPAETPALAPAAEADGRSTSRVVSTVVAMAIGVVVLAGALLFSYGNATCVRMESGYPEPEATRAIMQAGIRGRMLIWFDWGEYAIWHFAPAVSISMDGRRETVYSDEVVRKQFDFYFEPKNRQTILDGLKPDYIWLPANLEVVSALKSDGWTPLFSGDRSVLLARLPHDPLAIPRFGSAARRCFPGP